MDRDLMGNVINNINRPKTKYDIEKQYWIEYSEKLEDRIDKAIELLQDRDYLDRKDCFDELVEVVEILKGDSNE